MRYFTFLLALFLAGCGAYSANIPSIKPYKLDIQQGNAVTPKMMLQLRPGMNKTQVRFIMGTPLLTDTFHGDRWDYFYQMLKDGDVVERRRIILVFEDDKLKVVRGDVVPAGNDGKMTVEPITEPKSGTMTPKEKDEKGLLDKLKFWGNDDKKPAVVTPEAPKSEPAKVEAKPEAVPTPASEPVKDAIKPEPVAKPAEKKEKGLLDKLKFWENDEKAKLVEPAPEVKPEPKPEPVIEFKPEPMSEPAPKVEIKAEPAPEPAVKPSEKEEKGLLDKLKFWGDDEKTAPKAMPEPKPEPVIEFKPEIKPEPAPEPEVAKPAPKPPVAADKPIPKPSKDLPPEDAPDYFEKMLEKIGF
ncbi:MAG: outer membrane protein assembly factor BamE [Methylophilaceae bacterium]